MDVLERLNISASSLDVKLFSAILPLNFVKLMSVFIVFSPFSHHYKARIIEKEGRKMVVFLKFVVY